MTTTWPGSSRSDEPEVEILDDPEAVSAAAATTIAAALREAVADRGIAHWATTGGSTPVGIYRQLAVAPLRDAVPWNDVHIWWGDDRYVPRDHPLSNVLPLDQVLLSASARAGLSGTGEEGIDVDVGIEPGILIPVSNVHAMPITRAIANRLGPEGAAEAYEAELRTAGPPPGSNGLPTFDVILLGIGPDGHLFSVFPGSALFDSSAWVAGVPAPTHVEPHVARVSLNPRVLDDARLPLAVVHGAGKASILASVFGAARDPRHWPAQLVRRPGARWFLDRAAAAQLPG